MLLFLKKITIITDYKWARKKLLLQKQWVDIDTQVDQWERAFEVTTDVTCDQCGKTSARLPLTNTNLCIILQNLKMGQSGDVTHEMKSGYFKYPFLLLAMFADRIIRQ